MPDTQRGFNIGVFKQAHFAKAGVLRPNLFHVEFAIPNSIQFTNPNQTPGNISTTVRMLEYWCEATALPGLNIQTYQAQRYGYGAIEQRPLIPAYGETMFDIMFDAESLNHQYFYLWMNSIVNTDNRDGPNSESSQVTTGGFTNRQRISASPFELSYKEDYVADVRVYVYDKLGSVKKKIVLRDAFPKAIGDIRLAWADNNSYMRLPVAFAYTDWYLER